MRCVRASACALLVALPLLAATMPAAATTLSFNGLTVSRVFDLPSTGNNNFFANPQSPPSLISDTVFGRDSALPLAQRASALITPALFGAISPNNFANDARRVSIASESAIVGVHFKLLGGEQTVAFQNVAPAFVAGAPLQYSTQAPALFAFYNYSQLSAPLNDFGRPLDNPEVAAAYAALQQSQSRLPDPTLAIPLSDPFRAHGSPSGAYAVNPLAGSVQLNFPVTLSKTPATLRFAGQASTGVEPASLATQIFGPAFSLSSVGKYSALSGGVTLALPVFDRRATVNLDGLYERLTRDDKSPTGAFLAANPGSTPYNQVGSTGFDSVAAPTEVYFYPTSFDVKRYLGAASVAVPVTRALTVNGSFAEQSYGDQTLNALTQSLNERKTYGGGLLYNIPKTNSSVNLFFNRYVYSNDDVPSYSRAENRQNLYFSVKF